jgi:hypothetical protein
MLSPDEDYEPMPGNPNLLISKKKQKMEESPPPSPVDREEIDAIEDMYSPLFAEALQPLYAFVGFLEAASGKKIYYRYDQSLTLEEKQNPLVRGTKSIGEFRRRNAHLGKELLDLILLKPEVVVKQEKVNALIGLNPNLVRLYRQYVDPNATDYHMRAFPAAMWALLPDPVFQFLLGGATYGALVMSANELEHPLKLLIVSPNVNYRFAEFVSTKYLAPRSNAYASGINNGQIQYRISSGFATTARESQTWLMGAKLWFKNTFVSKNPKSPPEVEAEAEMNLIDNRIKEHYVESRRINPNLPMTWKEASDQLLLGAGYTDAINAYIEAKGRFEFLRDVREAYSPDVLVHVPPALGRLRVY